METHQKTILYPPFIPSKNSGDTIPNYLKQKHALILEITCAAHNWHHNYLFKFSKYHFTALSRPSLTEKSGL
jgi:hypothetical protein